MLGREYLFSDSFKSCRHGAPREAGRRELDEDGYPLRCGTGRDPGRPWPLILDGTEAIRVIVDDMHVLVVDVDISKG